jgi:hypothetical protein
MYGGSLTWTSIKFNRTPRLHSRLLFLQFMQSGAASSHFKCRSRHVKHPVLTRFDFAGADVGGALFSSGFDVGDGDNSAGTLATFVVSFWRFGAGNSNCSMEKHPRTRYGSGSSKNCEAKSSSIWIGDCW